MILNFKNKLNNDTYFRELVFGGFNSFVFKIVGIFISYLLTLYITNHYGATAYGTLTLLITIVAIFTLVPQFGMHDSLIRIVSELKILKRNNEIKMVAKMVLLFVFVVGSVFAFLLYISSNIISNNFLNKDISELIKLVSVLILSNALTVVMSTFFQGLGKIKTFAIISFVLNSTIFLLLILFSNTVNTIYGLIVMAIISSIVSFIIVAIILLVTFLKLKIDKEKKTNKYSLKEILKISSPMLMTSSFLMVIYWSDVIMLGIYKSEADVGVYHVVQKLTTSTNFVLASVITVFAPKVTKLYVKNDIQRLAVLANQATKIIFFVSLPILVGLLSFSNFIMGLFGDEFILGVPALILLTIAQFVNVSTGAVGELLNMTNYQKTKQKIVMTAAVVNIILNYILIPIYSINGAAIATMISIIFWNIAMVIKVKEKLNFWNFYFPFFCIRSIKNETHNI